MAENEKELELPEHGPVKPFLEHLEELRWVLIKIFSAVAIPCLACLFLGRQILEFLQYPLDRSGALKDLGVSDASQFLKVFGPADAFSIAFQLAFYAGLIIASPLVIYIIAAYVLPALTKRERHLIMPVFWAGTLLFLAGVFFCYFLVLPPALAVSLRFPKLLQLSVSFWTVESYVSFVTKFMLGMGVGFEMPLVILLLVKMGALDYSKLSKARRYVIVLNFILGAVLTTPEVFTQILMAIPLCLLYEACIWITWFWERKGKKYQLEVKN